jgi:hypothetical protein
MINTLDAALKGKLKDNAFPSTSGFTGSSNSGASSSSSSANANSGSSSGPVQSVVVFMIGGVTYEESTKVAEINGNRRRVILGGNTIHNSNTFLNELKSY